MKVKIIHQRDECIGCGSCCAVCPEFFEMDNEGKSKLTKKEAKYDAKKNKGVLEVEDVGCVEEAARVCPTQCIKITRR